MTFLVTTLASAVHGRWRVSLRTHASGPEADVDQRPLKGSLLFEHYPQPCERALLNKALALIPRQSQMSGAWLLQRPPESAPALARGLATAAVAVLPPSPRTIGRQRESETATVMAALKCPPIDLAFNRKS